MSQKAKLEKIANEYSQWKLVSKLLLRFTQATETFEAAPHRNGESVKIENLFGRWLAVLQFFACQTQEESSEYPLFPRTASSGERSKEELIRTLVERFKDMSQSQAAGIADELQGAIIAFLDKSKVQRSNLIEVKYKVNEKGGCIKVGDFRSEVCPLVSFLVDRYGLLSTALVCLRYDPLSCFKGGESGLTVTAFNALHDIGSATHEGFASPLNCRLLGRPGAKFCSLFADTDSAFGSLGNFFSVRLSDHPGGWVLSPPFVEPVLNATARKVLETLEEAEPRSFWFYIIFPMWKDNEGWQMLDRSERNVARIELTSRNYIVQDSYGTVIWPGCDVCVFIIGQLPVDVDLMKLRKHISCTDENTVKSAYQLCFN